MFVFSLKASRFKIVGACAFVLLCAFTVSRFFPEQGASIAASVSGTSEKIRFDGMSGASELASFAENIGFGVDKTPVETVSVEIPASFDRTLDKYNALQKSMGFDLSKYKNKTVQRVTFRVTSMPDHASLPSDQTLLSLILWRDRIIGGDVCVIGEGGSVAPFIK